MRRRFSGILGAALIIFGVTLAQAHFNQPEDAVAYRKAVMLLLSHHFGQIGAVIKGQVPYQSQDVAAHARLVQTFSTLPWEAFKASGSNQGATEAKATVFSQPEQFAAAAKALEGEAANLVVAAESEQLDSVKTQFGKVAQSCKGCHEQFKAH